MGASEQIEGTVDETRSPKIHVDGVHKRFGRITALDDVTLSIEENEIFCLVGDNGAGKSTLMNILCGIYPPSEGEVYFDGESIRFSNPSDARERGIETVFQDLALMDDLDVATNVFMGRFPRKGIGPFSVIDWDETYERTEQLITEDLGRDFDPRKEVEFLSGGQRQLVAIARALAFEPEVIILDEPTSALSVEATQLVNDTIRRLKDEGHTVIVVSHNLENALELADRIGVLFQGKLIEVADADELSLEGISDLIRGIATNDR